MCWSSATRAGDVTRTAPTLSSGQERAADERSGGVVEKKRFAERKVEPNSGLGEAILYMQKYWDKLTLFLRRARGTTGQQHRRTNAEDGYSSSEERAVLQNARTAPAWAPIMSLIYTCQLCGANPFDYLTSCSDIAEELAPKPCRVDALWNYTNTLERGVASGAAPS